MCDIDVALVHERFERLTDWLASVWGEARGAARPRPPRKSRTLDQLRAPIGGYYAWAKKPGEDVAGGKAYATVYLPAVGTRTEARASYPFTLLGIYGVPANAEGEQIGAIVRREE